MSYVLLSVIISVVLISGCLSQQEIRLDAQCTDSGINEICQAKCQSDFGADMEAWRCSASGQPVCLCKAYQQPPF